MKKLQKIQNKIRKEYGCNIEITGFVSEKTLEKSYSFLVRNMNMHNALYLHKKNYKTYKKCLKKAINYFNKNFKND